MKICWDNLENVHLTRNGKFRNPIKMKTYYIKICNTCGEEFLNQVGNKGRFCSPRCTKRNEEELKKISEANKKKWGDPKYKKRMSESHKGHKHSEEQKRKIGDAVRGKKHPLYGKKGKESPGWKGGYDFRIPLYNTYASKINWIEKVRRSKKDRNILEVKCAYCGKWFIPERYAVKNRVQYLNGNYFCEYKLYCSKECKQECPIYRKIKYPKGFKQATSREVQPELRQMRFRLDDYVCQKCGSSKSLHCHHIEGILWEPLESADIDKCITLCKSCHKEVHKLPGCGYNDLKCNNGEIRI